MTQPEMIHGLLRPMAERIERLEATNRDLLAALERLALMVRQYNDGAIICHRELAQADAAIDKAKGD